MGACVGFPAGVVLKLRGTRASQTLECPILLSSSYQDWKVGGASVWKACMWLF
jgi:hypothetical protein